MGYNCILDKEGLQIRSKAKFNYTLLKMHLKQKDTAGKKMMYQKESWDGNNKVKSKEKPHDRLKVT